MENLESEFPAPSPAEVRVPISHSKRRVARALSAITTPTLLMSALVAGSPAAHAASLHATSVPTGRAVVALSGVTSVTVPGVTVDAVLSAIHSELVHGSAAALRRLASAPGVLGLSADLKLKPASHDLAGAGSKSVFSWEGLGNEAGRAGAGNGVHVAVIDTGVSDSAGLNRASGHLVDAIDTSGLVTGGSVQTSGVFADGYGHGTFMASLIADASPVNRQGRTVGIAPGAIVDVVKVAGDDGVASFGSMMTGLNWVANHAATEQVANLSFGLSVADVGGYGLDPLNLATETLRYLGTNVVVSAGNVAGEVTDPGFDPRVITVGAADTRGWWPKLATFSGSAVVAGVSKPDLVAPGVGLLGVLPPDSAIVAANPASLQRSGYYRGSGTSEAAAIVSGLAAILVADNPGVTTAQVKASLRVSASPIDAPGTGAGLANVVNRLARSRDDRRMGDEGALGEATFSESAWLSNRWTSNSWTSAWWTANQWGSAGWANAAFSALSFGSNSWTSNSWTSNSWTSNSWTSNSWTSNSWTSNSWTSNSWTSNSWTAAAWGSESWGNDGGDGA
jgi:serine protease AprX